MKCYGVAAERLTLAVMDKVSGGRTAHAESVHHLSHGHPRTLAHVLLQTTMGGDYCLFHQQTTHAGILS
jgi:hypothetical protein